MHRQRLVVGDQLGTQAQGGKVFNFTDAGAQAVAGR